jgi:hypothetical protein
MINRNENCSQLKGCGGRVGVGGPNSDEGTDTVVVVL